jgi:glycosyltransferase involved in cell wall biosynthesis
MKVAFDHQIFSGQVYGGVSRYFFEVAKRIQTFDGYSLEILSPFFVNRYLNEDRSLKVWGKHVKQLPRPRRIVQVLNGELVHWKLNQLQPDIVHETYYLGRRLAPPNSKTVVTVYDMIHEKFPQCFPADDKTSQVKKAAVDRADHVICISENTRTDLIDLLHVPRAKTSVTHLAYAPSKRKTEPLERLRARPYIAYVGARVGYKNFVGLLRAFGLSKFLRSSFSLVCVGGGALTLEEREEMTRAGLHPDQAILLTGSDELLESVYRGAAAFVYPSLYEGFGLPPLEAMSAGCPVVCSRTSSLPEVCGDAAEYFDPTQPESIANSIERAVASNARRQELITLGLIQVGKFSWDLCARQTAAIYDAVLHH